MKFRMKHYGEARKVGHALTEKYGYRTTVAVEHEALGMLPPYQVREIVYLHVKNGNPDMDVEIESFVDQKQERSFFV